MMKSWSQKTSIKQTIKKKKLKVHRRRLNKMEDKHFLLDEPCSPSTVFIGKNFFTLY